MLALALIHHLVIGNSVPCGKAAEFLARLGPWLIVEFVDPADPRVRQLLSTRTDTHPYDEATFIDGFCEHYEIVRREPIQGSSRVLFLMRRRR